MVRLEGLAPNPSARNELACLGICSGSRRKKWNYLDKVRELEMPKAPEGRTRFLNQDEITRLLQACSQSKNTHLRAIVILAINNTAMRNEIMKLEWERIELDKILGSVPGYACTIRRTGNRAASI